MNDYMAKMKKRFEKIDKLNEEAMALKSELLRAEGNIKTATECSKRIQQFTETLNRTHSGYGYEVMVCVRRGSRNENDKWEELYRYHMGNFDDLMELIEDRLYKNLEDAIYYVKNSRKELAITTDQ